MREIGSGLEAKNYSVILIGIPANRTIMGAMKIVYFSGKFMYKNNKRHR